jgi:flavodoxin
MKALIIYCSQYKNNTKEFAQLFARKMDCELVNVKDVKDINNINIEKYDLIGFGSGVYKESTSPKIMNLIEKFNLKDKNVFVFSTSGAGMKFYNNSLIKKLKEKGAVVKGSFACKGHFIAKEFTNNKIFDVVGRLSKGHPNDKDLKKAEKFIKELI